MSVKLEEDSKKMMPGDSSGLKVMDNERISSLEQENKRLKESLNEELKLKAKLDEKIKRVKKLQELWESENDEDDWFYASELQEVLEKKEQI